MCKIKFVPTYISKIYRISSLCESPHAKTYIYIESKTKH